MTISFSKRSCLGLQQAQLIYLSTLKLLSSFTFSNDMSRMELLSKNDVIKSSSEISSLEHCPTNHASRRSKNCERAKTAVRSRSNRVQIVEQLPTAHLVSINRVKKEPYQELNSSPFVKLESQTFWNSPLEGSCWDNYPLPLNERGTYLTHQSMYPRQGPQLDLSSTTKTIKMEPPQMGCLSGRGLLNGAIDEAMIQGSETENLKKRSSKTAELIIDHRNAIEVNRAALVLPGLHSQRPMITTVIPTAHKKPRRTINLRVAPITLKVSDEYRKPSHLDPCPVIKELGRCQIGSQLYVAPNWEDRPGVCDPRQAKLCFTTCDKCINENLNSGKATIGAKVFYCDLTKNVKAEGWITADGILCSRCGFVLGCQEFKACAGLKRDQKGNNLLLISGAPLKAQSCRF